MEFETFRGRDVGEVMAAVKAAFGSDAWIGPTRHITNGQPGGLGQNMVEVKAAPAGTRNSLSARGQSPFEEESAAKPAAEERPERRALRPRPEAARAASTAAIAQTVSLLSADPALRGQLDAIRALLEELTASNRPKDRASAMLNAARIEGALATALAQGASQVSKKGSGALREWLRERIAEQLSVIASPIEQPGPRVVVCVGPTGVGKTTTLAKLAARAHIELQRAVSVITLDTFRVGSIEQMRRFTELIGVPFDVANDGASFSQALTDRQSEIVFVDTASLPPTNNAATRRLMECLATVADVPVDVLLVMPAMIAGRDAERLASVYQLPQPTGLVITKLDETEQAGGVLHAAIPREIPIAYLCGGPRVPEDIQVATVETVVDAVLPSVP